MSIPKQVRIQSDGTMFLIPHTTVIDTETGENVPMLTGLSLEMDVSGPIVAHLRVLTPQVDVIAQVGTVRAICPHCGHETEPDREIKG